ncbi:MAG: hypothetical protein K1X94_22025 [Sandaracinaceae bacterium]|nr:hypothetical protein [Sandaracinaceae bacterium]
MRALPLRPWSRHASFGRHAASIAIALFGVAGCGGSTVQTETTTPVHPYVPCENTAEVRFAPNVCFDPVGSHWHVVSNAPGGQYEFEVELMAGGRVRATDHPAAGPGTDEWLVEDDELRIFLANRFVEYRGHFTNGSVVVGDAANVRGDRWDWRADRVHPGGRCLGNELLAHEGEEPGCYSAAGSRWTVSTAGRSFVVELAANGTLTSDDPSDTTPGNDTWEQEGATLRFLFDARARTFEGTLQASDLRHVSGTVSGGGSFTAEAVPTYAAAPY